MQSADDDPRRDQRGSVALPARVARTKDAPDRAFDTSAGRHRLSDLVFLPDAVDANRAGWLGVQQCRELKGAMNRSAGRIVGVAIRRVSPLARDVRAGRVYSIEGTITKEVGTGFLSLLSNRLTGGQPTRGPASYRIWIADRKLGNQEFRSAKNMFEFAPVAGLVRLFYLPRSRWAVNLERVAATR